MHMGIGPHVADDVLENYLLQRLPEAELASVEEHLLVCQKCQVQAEETEEFILVTRAALQRGRRKPARRVMNACAGLLHSWLTVPVVAASGAAVAVFVFLPVRHVVDRTQPAEVRLYAMRGPNTVLPQVRAGAGLILDLDATGLPAGVEYGIRLVNTSGAGLWSGVSRLSGNQVRIVLGIKLAPGHYWVRLTRGGESVREYGLQLE